ncbi:hypothetical protein KUCAC02_026892 [Chaenocephalus aceratus]|nr:hypothetical protein KUCAC02_026892 [Chaenocephalus aceratus]
MTTTSQDPAPSLMAALLLFLLLLLPTVSVQTPVDPTTPSLFDLLTQPECTKKEHPKVSIQGRVFASVLLHPPGLQMSRLALSRPVLRFKGEPLESGPRGRSRRPLSAEREGHYVEAAV